MTSADLLKRFPSLRAVVVGDLMLDEYLIGHATRISPEAPVMVVRQTETRHVAGGAANVARNLAALGAQTTVVGVVGEDAAGEGLANSLRGTGLTADLVTDPLRPTTRKTRVLADHAHQVLRIDLESDAPLDPDVADQVAERAEARLAEADVLILSDYLKGTLTPPLVERLIRSTRLAGVSVVANPKPRSLAAFSGADLVSLNRVEAAEAAGRVRGLLTDEAEDAAREIERRFRLDALLVTLGEAGMLAVRGSQTVRVAAPKVEVYDTAGAGDTVIATVALGFAAAGFDRAIFQLAAETSAAVVRKVGVATPTPDDLASIAAAG